MTDTVSPERRTQREAQSICRPEAAAQPAIPADAAARRQDRADFERENRLERCLDP